MRKSYLVLTAVGFSLLLFGCGKTYEKAEVPDTFELAPGVRVSVEPDDALVVADLEPGQQFAGVLSKPLYYTRQDVELDGDTVDHETLVAPTGVPVSGVVVEQAATDNSPAKIGLKLTSITFGGGKSFTVETDPVYDLEAWAKKPAEPENRPALTFILSKPANVATVIDYRDSLKTAEAK